jgi:predicted nucleic acid-binding protein
MARLYVETSALLRALLEGDARLLERLKKEGARVTSALTFVEAARAVARARRDGRLSAEEARKAARWLAAFERSCEIVALSDRVLQRARDDFPAEPVRTLDALHLASIQVLDEELGDVEVASCDERLRRNLQPLGFRVVPIATA